MLKISQPDFGERDDEVEVAFGVGQALVRFRLVKKVKIFATTIRWLRSCGGLANSLCSRDGYELLSIS